MSVGAEKTLIRAYVRRFASETPVEVGIIIDDLRSWSLLFAEEKAEAKR